MLVGSTLSWCKANYPYTFPVEQPVVTQESLLGIELQCLGTSFPSFYSNSLPAQGVGRKERGDLK